jgi:hypothetical protein
MKITEFRETLKSLALRLKIRRAFSCCLLPVGCFLLAALLAVVLGKVSNSRDSMLLLAAAVPSGLALLLFGIVFLCSGVSDIYVALEFDQLAGLKERASSLMALRAAGNTTKEIADVLESDLERALAPCSGADVIGRCRPWLAGCRWLALLAMAIIAVLLIPSRSIGFQAGLVDVMAGGSQLAEKLDNLGKGKNKNPETAAQARRVLAIIRRPISRDALEVRKNGRELSQLAEKLRQAGQGDIADQLEDLVRALGAEQDSAGRLLAGSSSGRIPECAGEYPRRYQKLLSAYFLSDLSGPSRAGQQ